jgi:hypothetical protein
MACPKRHKISNSSSRGPVEHVDVADDVRLPRARRGHHHHVGDVAQVDRAVLPLSSVRLATSGVTMLNWLAVGPGPRPLDLRLEAVGRGLLVALADRVHVVLHLAQVDRRARGCSDRRCGLVAVTVTPVGAVPVPASSRPVSSPQAMQRVSAPRAMRADVDIGARSHARPEGSSRPAQARSGALAKLALSARCRGARGPRSRPGGSARRWSRATARRSRRTRRCR